MNVENLDLEFNLGEVVVDESGVEYRILDVVEGHGADIQYRYTREENTDNQLDFEIPDSEIKHENVDEMESEFRALEGTYCPVCDERCVGFEIDRLPIVSRFIDYSERFECVNDDCVLGEFTLDSEESESGIDDEVESVDDSEKREEIERLVEEDGLDEMEAIDKVLDNQGDDYE